MEKLNEMELKIGLLEKDVSQLNNFSERLLISIEKIQDVSNKLLQMLALHEQKMQQAEEDNKNIQSLVERRRSEINSDIKELHSRVTTVQRELDQRIETLEKSISDKLDKMLEELNSFENNERNQQSAFEKWKWGIMGAAMCIAWIFSHIKLDSLVSIIK